MTLPDQLISHSSLHHLCLLRWLYISSWPLSPGDISHSHSFLHCWSPWLERKLCLVSAVSPEPQRVSSTNYCAVWMDTGEFFPSIMITLGVVYSWWLKWKIWIYDKSYGRKYQIGGLRRYYPMENYRENLMDKEEQSLLLTYIELSCVLGPLLETFMDTVFISLAPQQSEHPCFPVEKLRPEGKAPFPRSRSQHCTQTAFESYHSPKSVFYHIKLHPLLDLKPDLLGLKAKQLLFLPIPGDSLAVQWLGFQAFTAGGRVQSLAKKLRSHKLHSTAKKKNYQPPNNTKYTCMSLLIALLSIIENYWN